MTTGKAATILGISIQAVIDLFDREKLQGFRLDTGSTKMHRRITALSLLEYMEKNMHFRMPRLLAFLNGNTDGNLEAMDNVNDVTSTIVANILGISEGSARRIMEGMEGYSRVGNRRRVAPEGLAAYFRKKHMDLRKLQGYIPLPHIGMLGTQEEGQALNAQFGESVDGVDWVLATQNIVTLGMILERYECHAVLISEAAAVITPASVRQIAELARDATEGKGHIPSVLLRANGAMESDTMSAFDATIEPAESTVVADRIRDILSLRLPVLAKKA